MALPMMTGIQFLHTILTTVTGAPARMPAGSRNMFATECSMLIATKAEIGNQMPTIFPPRSRAASERNTAMQTIQLHMIALTTAWPKGRPVFITVIEMASFLAPATKRPEYCAAQAKVKQPRILPKIEMVQLLTSSDIVALPSMTAIDTVAALPVKSWPPLLRIKSKFTGKSAAKTNFCNPGDADATAPRFPAIESERRPPKPTKQPETKDWWRMAMTGFLALAAPLSARAK
mmetsp:Transcript_143742/g.364861  ORF Transcript_143742/g.364861 Transcript_143742/m.364861 type:complete len:232 (+) Transcript_143742:495-1190(+)